MLNTLYFELIYNNRVYATVYREEDITIPFYDMVNGCNINPDDIIIKAHINGQTYNNGQEI